MSTSFSGLGIRTELVDTLHKQGLTEPTPVQKKAIPTVIAGRDVIAQAQTGTGKTLAFVLPILEKVNVENPHTQALIITPTRELALQITTEIAKLAPIVNARVLAAYGGQDVESQIRKLKGSAAHIVVGTPGRLLDHVRRGTIDLSQVSFLVLDEADQMLHMGFLMEVEDIILQTPMERQTMLFSATMPTKIRKLAANYMRSPQDIVIQSKRVTLDEIQQIVIETTDRAKQQALLEYIQQDNPYLAVVFCRTKIRAKNLTDALIEQGLVADELHGDLTQAKREQVMKRFRDAKLQILVATDVAARGLDVEGVSHVFNYDVPHDVESYIHRIGRTGRAGMTGVAVTLATPRDRQTLQMIEHGIGMKISRYRSSNSVEETEGLAPRPSSRQSGKGTTRQGSADTRISSRIGGRTPSRDGERKRNARSGGNGRGDGRFDERGNARGAGRATSRDAKPAGSTRGENRERSEARPFRGGNERGEGRPASPFESRNARSEGRGNRSDARGASQGARGDGRFDARSNTRDAGRATSRDAKPAGSARGENRERSEARPFRGGNERGEGRPASPFESRNARSEGRGNRSDARGASQGARGDGRFDARSNTRDAKSASGARGGGKSASGARGNRSARTGGAPGGSSRGGKNKR